MINGIISILCPISAIFSNHQKKYFMDINFFKPAYFNNFTLAKQGFEG